MFHCCQYGIIVTTYLVAGFINAYTDKAIKAFGRIYIKLGLHSADNRANDIFNNAAMALFVQNRESKAASASNSLVKRELCLAQGMEAVTTPCSGHVTRGMSAMM